LLDHSNLNTDVPFLNGILPSTENLAVAIWDQLKDALPSGHLHAIRLRETENNSVEYYGEGHA
ncbi:MAG: 6-carboxytetrahydropterin synthase, partial [Bacteroidota bacterium]